MNLSNEKNIPAKCTTDDNIDANQIRSFMKKDIDQDIGQINKQFKHLIDNSIVGFAIIDLSNRITYLNQTLIDSLQYATEEILGHPFHEFVIKSDMIQFRKYRHDRRIQGQEDTYTFHLKRKDGEILVVLIYGSPIYGPDGKISGSMATILDLSSQIKFEQKLKESEEKYRILVESSFVGICISDFNEDITFCNQLFADMVKYPVSELVSMNLSEIVPTEEILFYKEQSNLRKSGTPNVYENRLLRKDNTLIDILVHASTYNDSKGNSVGTIGIIQDITEQKKIERELRENKAKLSRYFEFAPYGIFILTPDGNILDVNSIACKYAGVPREELQFSNIMNNETFSNVNGFQSALQRVVEDESAFLRMQSYDKSLDVLNYYEIELILFPDNEILCFMRDVSDFEINQQLLSLSEQKYRNLYNSLGDSVFIQTMQGNIVDVNPEACRSLGYSREEFLTMKMSDIQKDKTPGQIKQKILQNNSKDHGFRYECEFFNKNHRELLMDNFARIINFSERQAILTISRDITAQRKAEVEQMQITKLNSLGILAGGIAHDFNNFLMAISGNLQLARLDPENENKYLGSMEGAINRASQLAQKLLTFSKGGAPVKESASLEEIVKETTDFILEGSKILPKYKFKRHLWNAEVDTGQISQVIQNLVENAKQAMKSGGIVEIQIQNETINKKSSFPLPSGKYIHLSISDQGEGISKTDLPFIYDPYFTTKPEGHGLGLTICYSIIEKHNGYIYARSKKGRGTTFHIYLPATDDHILQKADEFVSPGCLKKHCHILIMDDDDGIRQPLRIVLEKNYFTVDEAKDGKECISLFQNAIKTKNKYDLVIMDLTIPGGMGGEEVITELLKLDPLVNCIVSSGYSTDPIMSNPQKYGFRAAIAKPYSFNALLNLIHSIIPNQR